jgi:hypothetical protein
MQASRTSSTVPWNRLTQTKCGLQENNAAIHEQIGVGLAQLDRGEGLSTAESRARLQEKKAAWLEHQENG